MTRSPERKKSTGPAPRRPWYAHAVATVHDRLWRTRAVTLGVRAVVLDGTGGVLLVRHSYTPGWYLPGGGVDRGETAEAAVIRETREEAGILCLERPVLHGLFHNARLPRDHVACYVIRHFEQVVEPARGWEIAESGFFPLDALPKETTGATCRRLGEVIQAVAVSATW